MIQLTETLSFDDSKTFDEQTNEVKGFLINSYYQEALLEPSLAMRQQVASAGKLNEETTVTDGTRETVFDIFARPRLVKINFETYILSAERQYIEEAPNWRMHSETITLTIKN